MKKLVTLDSVMVSFIAAMGYGIGYTVPGAYGLNAIICFLICMALGTVLNTIADKIIFSSFVQKNNKRRYIAFFCTLLVFIAGYIFLARIYAYSLWTDVGTEMAFSVVIPIVTFFISLVVKAIKRKKLLEKYGTGDEGFIFDEEVIKKTEIFNGINAEVNDYSGKDPVVKTATGSFIGKREKDYIRFLGIPYATAKRWEKPEPLGPSDKTYEAYYFGNCEIQPESTHNVLKNFKQGEDCLNLNIWTAKLEKDKKKPVFIYFHGGDGRYGGSANPLYNLANLSKAVSDGVFVSLNYRIGLFGVIGFEGSENKDTTRLSLFDQIEALKWIKNNIAAFGGDPDNITVAGDDAGGSCICLLASMEEAKGLFKKAYIMCASTFDMPKNSEKAYLLGKNLAAKYDISAVSAEELRDFYKDNYYLIELPPRDSVSSEYDSDIEFIFGISADDISGWTAMLAGEISIDEMCEKYFDDFKKAAGEEGADALDLLLDKYMESGLNMTEAKKLLLADFQYKACVLHDIRTLVRKGCKVKCFYWDVEGDVEKLTANSVSMVSTVLGNKEIAEQMGYLNEDSITEIAQAFINKFIHGKPLEFYNNEMKGVPEIKWDDFTKDKDNVLVIKKDRIMMSCDEFSGKVRTIEELIFKE